MDDRRAPEVLLVEDDSNDVAVALRALHRHALRDRVKVLRDGVELLDYLFEMSECVSAPPKVILLDLKMPRLDGRTALRELRMRRETRHVPVVVVSSSDQQRDVRDYYELGDFQDSQLQREVDRALDRLSLGDEAQGKRLAVALIDLSDLDEPRVAAVNGDVMMYAASLPKIAVLLGAFEKVALGKMALDPETQLLMRRMIRQSSNEAPTELMARVGKEYIARVLLSPRYRLYDPRHNGGELGHKFVGALRKIPPDANLFHKSGSWGTFHSDSVLVERNGRSYIAVALSNDRDGTRWLERIIVALDGLVFREGPSLAREPRPGGHGA